MFGLLFVGLVGRLGFDLLDGIGLLVIAGPARGRLSFDRFDLKQLHEAVCSIQKLR